MTPAAIAANKANAKKAGRPVGSLSEQARLQKEMRLLLVKEVEANFGVLLRAQIELARGVWIEEDVASTDSEGNPQLKRRVYRKPPSQEAIKYLTDQAIGKPKETKDLNVDDKRALTIDELEAMQRGEFIDEDEESEGEED